MTNGEKIIDVLRNVADFMEDGNLASVMLMAARSEQLNPGGDLYALWCDNCGGCAVFEDEDCNDDRQIACIQRFLDREFTGCL